MRLEDTRVRTWFENDSMTDDLRYFTGKSVSMSSRGNRPLMARLNDLRLLYDMGLIDLFLRRIEDTEEFEYLARKRVTRARIPETFTFRAHGLAR